MEKITIELCETHLPFNDQELSVQVEEEKDQSKPDKNVGEPPVQIPSDSVEIQILKRKFESARKEKVINHCNTVYPDLVNAHNSLQNNPGDLDSLK